MTQNKEAINLPTAEQDRQLDQILQEYGTGLDELRKALQQPSVDVEELVEAEEAIKSWKGILEHLHVCMGESGKMTIPVYAEDADNLRRLIKAAQGHLNTCDTVADEGE